MPEGGTDKGRRNNAFGSCHGRCGRFLSVFGLRGVADIQHGQAPLSCLSNSATLMHPLTPQAVTPGPLQNRRANASRRVFEPRTRTTAPTGRHMSAQGNALGFRDRNKREP